MNKSDAAFAAIVGTMIVMMAIILPIVYFFEFPRYYRAGAQNAQIYHDLTKEFPSEKWLSDHVTFWNMTRAEVENSLRPYGK